MTLRQQVMPKKLSLTANIIPHLLRVYLSLDRIFFYNLFNIYYETL